MEEHSPYLITISVQTEAMNSMFSFLFFSFSHIIYLFYNPTTKKMNSVLICEFMRRLNTTNKFVGSAFSWVLTQSPYTVLLINDLPIKSTKN